MTKPSLSTPLSPQIGCYYELTAQTVLWWTRLPFDWLKKGKIKEGRTGYCAPIRKFLSITENNCSHKLTDNISKDVIFTERRSAANISISFFFFEDLYTAWTSVFCLLR